MYTFVTKPPPILLLSIMCLWGQFAVRIGSKPRQTFLQVFILSSMCAFGTAAQELLDNIMDVAPLKYVVCEKALVKCLLLFFFFF